MGWYESCLKPVIEVATFIGVVCALLYQESIIKSQRKEFERQRIKDNKQSFEQTFNFFYNQYKVNQKELYTTNNVTNSQLLIFIEQNIILPGLKGDVYHNLNKSLSSSQFNDHINKVCKLKLNTFVLSASYVQFLLVTTHKIDVLDDKKKEIEYKRKYLLQVFSERSNYDLTIILCLFLSDIFKEAREILIRYQILDNLTLSVELSNLVDKYKPLT